LRPGYSAARRKKNRGRGKARLGEENAKVKVKNAKVKMVLSGAIAVITSGKIAFSHHFSRMAQAALRPEGAREPQWFRTKFTSRRNGEARKGGQMKS